MKDMHEVRRRNLKRKKRKKQLKKSQRYQC